MMTRIVNEDRLCTGCSACSQICPCGAIAMEADDEGFLFPRIDENRCNGCGLCSRTCPVSKCSGNVGATPVYNGKKAFACRSLNDGTRERSSSGGIFSELADKTLRSGGVVFGAAFDGDFNVRHAFTENIEGLDELRRSKYVQSAAGNTFRLAKEFLDAGREVLYCGTPCQIAGLKSFLGKGYEKLTACDLACFGVPSPKVWQMYLGFLKDRHKSGIKGISFRDKSGGWKEYRMRISFANGGEYLVKAKDELYFIGFGKNIFSRRSCFDCRFRMQNSAADITLADFWGIDKMSTGISDDNMGISLAITHTVNGENALAAIGSTVAMTECDAAEAVRYNPRLVSSASEPAGRASFFADMKNGYSFDMLRRKYMDNFSIKYKLKRMIKKVLGRG